jgi:hypothetical protein
MALAAGAADLGADHAVAGVAHEGDVLAVDRVEEARPAGAGFELGTGIEQGQPAEAAAIGAFLLGLVEDAAERPFRSVLQKNAALLVVEIGDEPAEFLRIWGCQVEARTGALSGRGG